MRKLNDHPFAGTAPPGAFPVRTAWRPRTRSVAGGHVERERPGKPGGGEPSPSVLPQVVIGADDRKQITQTRTYPARAIAHIVVRYQNGGEMTGTGWFIGPRVLATAAHVVAGNVKFIAAAPGRNAADLPFGFSNAVKWVTSARWNNIEGGEGDYAAIELEKPLGDAVGHFGLRVFSDQALSQTRFWVAGYPADKPSGTMWAHEGPVAPSSRFLDYTTDTHEGQSGSPVFVKMADGFWAGGLHVAGADGVGNRAIRITGAVFDELTGWQDGL